MSALRRSDAQSIGLRKLWIVWAASYTSPGGLLWHDPTLLAIADEVTE